MKTRDIRQRSINTVRALAMDAVQRANSGHPGTPMALAPVAYTIFTRFLKHNPENPEWPDRDRFVLSVGHASMLLYSALHLTGYDLSLDDLKDFRQWGSKTPGHPEFGHAPGVETTTGPLGQGFANGVGLAMAERFLAGRYNLPGKEIVDHHVYALCSDGDLMEGVSQEAASIAGHLGLGKLIYVYDDNHITIDGTTEISFDREDKALRFEAYGWHVRHVDDSEDLEAIEAALREAKEETERPSLIVLRSHIAYPAPNAIDTPAAHGAPLGEDEVRATKKKMGFDPDEHFAVPDGVYEHMDMRGRGRELEAEWRGRRDGRHKRLRADDGRRGGGPRRIHRNQVEGRGGTGSLRRHGQPVRPQPDDRTAGRGLAGPRDESAGGCASDGPKPGQPGPGVSGGGDLQHLGPARGGDASSPDAHHNSGRRTDFYPGDGRQDTAAPADVRPAGRGRRRHHGRDSAARRGGRRPSLDRRLRRLQRGAATGMRKIIEAGRKSKIGSP